MSRPINPKLTENRELVNEDLNKAFSTHEIRSLPKKRRAQSKAVQVKIRLQNKTVYEPSSGDSNSLQRLEVG